MSTSLIVSPPPGAPPMIMTRCACAGGNSTLAPWSRASTWLRPGSGVTITGSRVRSRRSAPAGPVIHVTVGMADGTSVTMAP
jgi:hypothetical protein